MFRPLDRHGKIQDHKPAPSNRNSESRIYVYHKPERSSPPPRDRRRPPLTTNHRVPPPASRSIIGSNGRYSPPVPEVSTRSLKPCLQDYSPYSNGEYRGKLPPRARAIVGDTRHLYNDGGSEMSFDTSSEASSISPAYRPTAGTRPSYASTSASSTTLTPSESDETISLTRTTPSSPAATITPSQPVSAYERDYTIKRYKYYSDRSVGYANVGDWANAERYITRAVDLAYSWPGNTILEICEKRQGRVLMLFMQRCLIGNWEAALAVSDLFDEFKPAIDLPDFLDFLCDIVISFALLGNNRLDEAQSRCQDALEACSQTDLLKQDLRCFENILHKILAVIMAKKGDMLEAGFYKSLYSPAKGSEAGLTGQDRSKEREGLGDIVETLEGVISDFNKLWDSI